MTLLMFLESTHRHSAVHFSLYWSSVVILMVAPAFSVNSFRPSSPSRSPVLISGPLVSRAMAQHGSMPCLSLYIWLAILALFIPFSMSSRRVSGERLKGPMVQTMPERRILLAVEYMFSELVYSMLVLLARAR